MKFHACIALYTLTAVATSTLHSENEGWLADNLRSKVENRQGLMQDEKYFDGALRSIETMKSLRSKVENSQGLLQDENYFDAALRSIETTKAVVQNPDILKDVSQWNDCSGAAPFIITNHNLKSDWGRKWFYMWDDLKTPHEPWKFLTNIQFVESNYWKDYAWVEEMDADDALSMLHDAFVNSGKKKIMFFVHGWNSPVESAWCGAKSFKDMSEYFAIPVIWRTDHGPHESLDYYYDRVHTAPNAGITLSNLFNSFFAQIQYPKAWMCHSMGCHVTQFFAQEVSEAGDFEEINTFDNVFLVAPDLRYDIFNEWPLGSGQYKNECSEGQWNATDDNVRIPDCRLGGGDAFVDMSHDKVQVHWNQNDYVAPYKVTLLSNNGDWPISAKALLSYGDKKLVGGRAPDERFNDTVTFIHHDEFGTVHSYQFTEEMMEIYDESASGWIY